MASASWRGAHDKEHIPKGWRKQFGEIEPTDITRLRELEAEDAKLKRMVAEQKMAIDMLNMLK